MVGGRVLLRRRDDRWLLQPQLPGLRGRNPRGHGAEVVYATAAGIWVGSDTDYVGNYQYKRQKLDFFPFAGGTAAAGNDTGDTHTVLIAGANGAATLTANTFDATTGAG